MAVMAGLLDVRLEKLTPAAGSGDPRRAGDPPQTCVYALGDPGDILTPAKVRQAWRIVMAAGVAMVILSALACFVVNALHVVWAILPGRSMCAPP